MHTFFSYAWRKMKNLYKVVRRIFIYAHVAAFFIPKCACGNGFSTI